jgi:hypothetical protein
MPEMFWKNESNQCHRGRGDHKKDPQAPWVVDVKARPPPRANALPKYELSIDSKSEKGSSYTLNKI